MPTRLPRDLLCARPIYEGIEISCLQIEVLNTELRCPICLNILRDPVATECMHRFCAGCIEKCLRVGKKECPTCRKPVATKRNLRKDTNFQDLITKLYPDLEDFEEEEDRLISNVATRARMVAITAEQQQDMIKHQRNHPPSPHYHAPSYNAPKRPRPQAVGGGGGGGDIYESDGMDESGTEEGGGSESFEDEVAAYDAEVLEPLREELAELQAAYEQHLADSTDNPHRHPSLQNAKVARMHKRAVEEAEARLEDAKGGLREYMASMRREQHKGRRAWAQ